MQIKSCTAEVGPLHKKTRTTGAGLDGGNVVSPALLEKKWIFLTKLEIKLPYVPAITLIRVYYVPKILL